MDEEGEGSEKEWEMEGRKGEAKGIWREMQNRVSGRREGKEGEGQDRKEGRRRRGERGRRGQRGRGVVEIVIVIIWIVGTAA
jgi:hypothetical protein